MLLARARSALMAAQGDGAGAVAVLAQCMRGLAGAGAEVQAEVGAVLMDACVLLCACVTGCGWVGVRACACVCVCVCARARSCAQCMGGLDGASAEEQAGLGLLFPAALH